MKRGMLYLVAAIVIAGALLVAATPLRTRFREVATNLKLIKSDTGDVMASATYQRFAVRRRAVESMQKTLVALARAESLFVADSGRPFTNLPQGERYAVPNDPSNLLYSPQLEQDRWSARINGLHTTMACSITAFLDTTTGRYHAGAPVCSEMRPDQSAVATSAEQDQAPRPRVVDLVTHPRPVNNTPPAMPWIQRGICPGPDCTFGQWTACATIVVTREKHPNSPAIFTLSRGAEFTALTGDVHVSKPGLVVFRSEFTEVLEKKDASGPVVTLMHFTPADTLYPLLYLADRQMVLWFRGVADTGADFWRPDPAVYRPDALKASRLIESPVTTWWIRVRNTSGQEGWAVFDFDTMWRAASRDDPQTCRTEQG